MSRHPLGMSYRNKAGQNKNTRQAAVSNLDAPLGVKSIKCSATPSFKMVVADVRIQTWC